MFCEERNISKKNVVFVLIGTFMLLLIFSMTVFESFTEKTVTYNGTKNIDNSKIKFYIDSQQYDKSNDFLTIKGWAFLEGETIKTYQCHVVLRDKETDECIELPTQLVVRKDVTEAFKSSQNQLDYDKSGFQAKLKLHKLKKPLQNYEICLDYNNNNANIFVKTGVLLMKEGK